MKYAALGEHLRGLATTKAEATLRFAEIERMIGATLPKSARTYREWWANQDGGSRAPHWRAAGFEIENVDFARELVRFRRIVGATTVPKQAKAKKTASRPDAPHRDVLLRAGFREIGAWTLEKDALVLGGDVPAQSATYAVVVNKYVQYVGSSTGRGLKRRMYFYGKPGKGQRTSLRINALIKEKLLAGDTVELIAAFPPPTVWNGLPVDVVMGLELGLIKKFCPPWNKRGVSGQPLEKEGS
jgi:hypothetical protein